MFGSIAGDIVGSLYEAHPIKTKDFHLYNRHASFTDDTVLTVATAYSLIRDIPYTEAYKKFGRAYPARGYGGNFQNWLVTPMSKPYFSFGNGSAMRVSPVGWFCDSIRQVLDEAERALHVHTIMKRESKGRRPSPWLFSSPGTVRTRKLSRRRSKHVSDTIFTVH